MEDDPVLTLRQHTITTDKLGNVCLNDMWAAAGRPENKRPVDWKRGKRVAALEDALLKRMVEILHRSIKQLSGTTYYIVGRGTKAKTFAHPVLAIDYAEFLDPAIGVEVREVFLRYKSNDVSLAVEIMGAMTSQAEYDSERVKLRDLVIEHNKQSVGVAKDAGVKNFEAYNGAGLFGLYQMTRAQLLRHKGLPADANHLDHANHEELAANYFKATQAIAKIKREGIVGQKAAETAHAAVAAVTRDAIKAVGGTMPEDEDALEHIKEARKRQKAVKHDTLRSLPSMPVKK